MSKKIIGIIIVIFIIGLALYAKTYYPGSQFQLRNSFRSTIATPIENFYNATESSCGIWYERTTTKDNRTEGKDNSSISRCFRNAFEKCTPKNILLIKDNNTDEKGSITYSLMRIIKSNDDGKCIVQNYYEEYSHTAPDGQIPLNYINTCTTLSDDIYSSCEPQYIKDQRTAPAVTIE